MIYVIKGRDRRRYVKEKVQGENVKEEQEYDYSEMKDLVKRWYIEISIFVDALFGGVGRGKVKGMRKRSNSKIIVS